jgi:hypothetical protein
MTVTIVVTVPDWWTPDRKELEEKISDALAQTPLVLEELVSVNEDE